MKIRILKGKRLADNSLNIVNFYKNIANKKEYSSQYILNSNICGIIEDDFGRIIGISRVFTDFCSHAFITDIYISEKYRFKGYGTSLLSSLCDHLRKQGLKKVFIFNENTTKKIEYFLKNSNFSEIKNSLYIRNFY